MTRRLLAAVSIVLLLLSIASVALAAGKTYSADRFDADWYVQQDGSLIISENVTFKFSGGPFTYVYRELPDDYSDGIELLTVSMDGDQLSPGSGAGQYEVTDSGQKVTWHFAPTSDETHTFNIVYQAHGAIRREGGQDLLAWNFLPTDYEYPIDSATLKIGYPYEVQPVGPPEVRRGQADFSQGPGLTVFTASDIAKNSPLTVALRFPQGSLIAQPPAWQQHADALAQRAPSVWLAATAVLWLGAGALVVVWRGGRRRAGSLSKAHVIARSAPPSDLSPALAGGLLNYNGKATAIQAMATLFSLAQRGVVTFEQTGEQKWYRSATFVVRLQRGVYGVARLDPHEQALIDKLFVEKGREDVPLTKLGQELRKASKPFGKAVEAQLVERGLLDPARLKYGARIYAVAYVLLALLVVAFAGAVVLWQDFGGWSLLLPLAFFVLSMFALIMGAAYSPRSEAGEAQAADWRGFRDYMKNVVKGREPAWDLGSFDRFFPYAATFDFTEQWARAFQARGGSEVPAWFRSLSAAGGNNFGAFIVMTSAAHSSTSSGGGGGGGGGAGGGGGSGAG